MEELKLSEIGEDVVIQRGDGKGFTGTFGEFNKDFTMGVLLDSPCVVSLMEFSNVDGYTEAIDRSNMVYKHYDAGAIALYISNFQDNSSRILVLTGEFSKISLSDFHDPNSKLHSILRRKISLPPECGEFSPSEDEQKELNKCLSGILQGTENYLAEQLANSTVDILNVSDPYMSSDGTAVNVLLEVSDRDLSELLLRSRAMEKIKISNLRFFIDTGSKVNVECTMTKTSSRVDITCNGFNGHIAVPFMDIEKRGITDAFTKALGMTPQEYIKMQGGGQRELEKRLPKNKPVVR